MVMGMSVSSVHEVSQRGATGVSGLRGEILGLVGIDNGIRMDDWNDYDSPENGKLSMYS